MCHTKISKKSSYSNDLSSMFRKTTVHHDVRLIKNTLHIYKFSFVNALITNVNGRTQYDQIFLWMSEQDVSQETL